MPKLKKTVTNEELALKDKEAAGKKASKAADKKREKITQAKEAKKIANQALSTIADNLPHGEAKAFYALHLNNVELRKKVKVILAAININRKEMKAMKIDLPVYDHVVKMMAKDPADAAAFKASEAIYTKQLGGELSQEQQDRIMELHGQRIDAAKKLVDMASTDTGKEAGTLSAPLPEGEEGVEGEEATAAAPARNDALTGIFTPAQTH